MRFPTRLQGLALALPFVLGSAAAPLQDAPAPQAAAAPQAELTASIDAFLDAHHALDQFSGAVLVADRGRVVYQGARGEANSDWAIPNAPSTKFRIASVTKQFTALAILQLVDAGALELDAPITRYLTDYPAESGDKVTVRHLLNHTSGIPSYTERPNFFNDEAKERLPVDEFVKAYCSDPLEFEPGSQFNYNNSGYFLLGAILEEVTGQTYAEVLGERIFTPLGMRDTGIDDQYRVVPGRAVGYDDILGGRRIAKWMDMSTPFAAGAMYTTVGDLWKWDQALRAETLLQGDLAREMVTPGLGDYGFGWEITELPAETGLDTDGGTRIVNYHGGGMPGVSTLIWRVPAEERCIIVLGNTMQTMTFSIQRGLAELLAGRDPGPVRARGDFEIARTVLEEGNERALEDLAKWPEHVQEDYIRRDVIGLAHRLLEQERYAEAVALTHFLTLAFPDDPEVWDGLGYVHMTAGNNAEAIEAYGRLVELDPSADGIRSLIEELKAEAR